MSTPRVIATVFVLIAGVGLLGASACTGRVPPDRTPVTTPLGRDDILHYQSIGGGPCPPGGCGGGDLHITADGSWTLSRGTPGTVVRTGRLDASATAELTARIAAGIDGVARLPVWYGPCPVGLDAPVTVWTFVRAGRAVAASNCNKVFGRDPLIAYASTVVSSLLSAG